MIKKIYLYFIGLLVIAISFSGCRQSQPGPVINDLAIPLDSTRMKSDRVLDYDTSQWLEITTDHTGILLDLRYATENNFTSRRIYDCARCFLRPDAARKLVQLNRGINERYGLSLKLFDCYRPKPFQQKLWDIKPDPSYVTPPAKGSMHNRGLAIDVTLVDENGEELNMGTDFDFFGIEAHTDNYDLPEEVLRNRKVLETMMREIGFKGIRTEWWHFSYTEGDGELSDWTWTCNEKR
jgi:D-alanyl-D-alanine dipeptidase